LTLQPITNYSSTPIVHLVTIVQISRSFQLQMVHLLQLQNFATLRSVSLVPINRRQDRSVVFLVQLVSSVPTMVCSPHECAHPARSVTKQVSLSVESSSLVHLGSTVLLVQPQLISLHTVMLMHRDRVQREHTVTLASSPTFRRHSTLQLLKSVMLASTVLLALALLVALVSVLRATTVQRRLPSRVLLVLSVRASVIHSPRSASRVPTTPTSHKRNVSNQSRAPSVLALAVSCLHLVRLVMFVTQRAVPFLHPAARRAFSASSVLSRRTRHHPRARPRRKQSSSGVREGHTPARPGPTASTVSTLRIRRREILLRHSRVPRVPSASMPPRMPPARHVADMNTVARKTSVNRPGLQRILDPMVLLRLLLSSTTSVVGHVRQATTALLTRRSRLLRQRVPSLRALVTCSPHCALLVLSHPTMVLRPAYLAPQDTSAPRTACGSHQSARPAATARLTTLLRARCARPVPGPPSTVSPT
jgi:hypothetical protein